MPVTLVATAHGLFRPGEPESYEFGGKNVRALIADRPEDSGATRFAVVGRHEIWRLGAASRRGARMDVQIWSRCACGNRLWIGTGGAHGNRGSIYRRPVAGGEPFRRCATEWFAGNVDTFRLSASGETFIAGGPPGCVVVSPDAGVTWREEQSGLPEINAVLALADGSEPAR